MAKPLVSQPRKSKRPPGPDFGLIAELRALGYRKIIGVDEVGRGALAGPVVVAAVELTSRVEGVTDSKLLPPLKRQSIARQIHQAAEQMAFGSASAAEIDSLGIVRAVFFAYERALEQIEADLVLTDFVRLPGRKFITQPQGDRYFYPVAAASIIAKVYRDQLMRTYHLAHPEYGWQTNVGYGTAEHKTALNNFGPVKLHRQTFL